MTEENLQDMASAIADHIWLLQSQLDASKEYILSQPGALSRERLDSKLFALESDIRNDQVFREQSAEWKRAIQAKDGAQDILRSLHSLVVTGKMEA